MTFFPVSFASALGTSRAVSLTLMISALSCPLVALSTSSPLSLVAVVPVLSPSSAGTEVAKVKRAEAMAASIAGGYEAVPEVRNASSAWSSAMASGTFSEFPDAVRILLEYVKEEIGRMAMRAAVKPPVRPREWFRIDAKAAQEDIVVGGWETYHATDPSKCRWFSVRLGRKTAPWAYLKGDPYRSIASLELIAVLISVMVFGSNKTEGAAMRSVALTAYTDNCGNSHVLKKFGSSKYPLSIIVMELASQLDRQGIDLQLEWIPRGQNCEADDLTNERFEDFAEERRIEVDFESLGFLVMPRLMEEAGRLDSELKIYKTSREAKLDKIKSGEIKLPETKKRKKGQLRWEDPW